MAKILVTGATGNVGREVLRIALAAGHDVVAGTRDGAGKAVGSAGTTRVDFEAGVGPQDAFDAIFLMRPPQITDPEVFVRFLDPHPPTTRIVFLSVQGAGAKAYLPHAKIEKRIVEMGFAHVFVRPSYFMENLLTSLWPELKARRRVYLPAGRLAFDWISALDVAALCVAALEGRVMQKVVRACTGERAGFHHALAQINDAVGTNLRYQPAGLPGFVAHERRRGTDWGFIAVMLLLHYLPRLSQPDTSEGCDAARILGRAPETLGAFAMRHEARFARLRD